MHTLKDTEGNVYAEVLWNCNRECFAIRNYMTMKVTDYKTRERMNQAWERIKYQLRKYFHVEDQVEC